MILIHILTNLAEVVKISPHENGQLVLAKNLHFIQDAGFSQSIWSLDYNGKLFRLRHKDRYLAPTGKTTTRENQPQYNNPHHKSHMKIEDIEMIKGDSNMKQLAKTEALGPLVDALDINNTLDSDSSSIDINGNQRNIKRAIKVNADNAYTSSSTSSSNSSSSSKKNSKDNKKKSKDEKKREKERKKQEKKQKELEKKNKKMNKTIEDKQNRANSRTSDYVDRNHSPNVDPVRVTATSNLIKNMLIDKAVKKSFALKNDSTDMATLLDEENSKSSKGPGFYWQLIPVFHSGISKKLVIKYKDSCLTTRMTMESCPFAKFWRLPARFYWNIYPTVNNVQINKISQYLNCVQQVVNQNRKAADINFDSILMQQGIVDHTKYQQSSEESCEESSSDECDCASYCAQMMMNMQPGNILNGSFNTCNQPNVQNQNNCATTLPMVNNQLNGLASMQNLQTRPLLPAHNCCNQMDCTGTVNMFDNKKLKGRQ